MILIPTSGPSDWKSFLAEPEKQWRTGYSARSTAYCWEEATGFPSEILSVLTSNPDFDKIEPLVIIPEHQVPLPGGSRPSQNDVWVLARTPDGLVSIAVEAKARETFGPTIAEWDPSSSPGKTTRLARLAELLGLEEPVPSDIRYQLLHRTGSALLEARRFHASSAVMLVHSFGAPGESRDDFSRFVELLGGEPATDRLIQVGGSSDTALFVGWANGDERFLLA